MLLPVSRSYWDPNSGTRTMIMTVSVMTAVLNLILIVFVTVSAVILRTAAIATNNAFTTSNSAAVILKGI